MLEGDIDVSGGEREAAEVAQKAVARVKELEGLYWASKEKYEITVRELEQARSEPVVTPLQLAAAEEKLRDMSNLLEGAQEAHKQDSNTHQEAIQTLQTRVSSWSLSLMS